FSSGPGGAAFSRPLPASRRGRSPPAVRAETAGRGPEQAGGVRCGSAAPRASAESPPPPPGRGADGAESGTLADASAPRKGRPVLSLALLLAGAALVAAALADRLPRLRPAAARLTLRLTEAGRAALTTVGGSAMIVALFLALSGV